MKRPAFQFYPADWRNNAKLRRCSPAARGVWVDILCLLHDTDEYGVLRWPLKDVIQAAGAPPALVRELVDKGVLKGADRDAEAYVFRPTHGGKNGEPVTLVAPMGGPVWYSSRFVRDEYVRQRRGASTHFGEANPAPNHPPKGGAMASPKGGIGERQGYGPSSSSSYRNTENYPGSGAGARVGPDDDDPMPGQQPTAAGLLCRRLRQAGIGNVNPGHPRLAALLAVGAAEAEFLAFADKAMTASDPFAYLLGAVEGERKRAAETQARLQGGPAPEQRAEPPVTVPSTEAEKTAAYLAQRAADRPAGGPLPEHVKSALAHWRSRKPTHGPAAQPEGEPT